MLSSESDKGKPAGRPYRPAASNQDRALLLVPVVLFFSQRTPKGLTVDTIGQYRGLRVGVGDAWRAWRRGVFFLLFFPLLFFSMCVRCKFTKQDQNSFREQKRRSLSCPPGHCSCFTAESRHARLRPLFGSGERERAFGRPTSNFTWRPLTSSSGPIQS